MPITREKLTEVQRPLDLRIVEYLDANHGNAFALSEIVMAVEEYPSDEIARFFLGIDHELAARYQTALAKLKIEEKIEDAEHRGTTYYMVKARTGL
jgi:hypothetical protein